MVGPIAGGHRRHGRGPRDGRRTTRARPRTRPGYIRESILDPERLRSLAGPTYSANGVSLMPPGFGQSLQPAQVDPLVAYLMTLK